VLPKDFDEFVEKSKDLVLVDVRNDYEVEMGTFRGAINPKTDTFQDFVEFVDNSLPSDKPETPIAMFCTGGVRCEKATAFLKRKGFKNVFHLKGGILQYLEDVPENKSSWKGECYVFDRRVSVDHGLRKGSYVVFEREAREFLSYLSLQHAPSLSEVFKQQFTLSLRAYLLLSM
jgi:UPF0176 protein